MCALWVWAPSIEGQIINGIGASEVQENSGQTYPVRGTVINSVTHQPIARVLANGQQDAVLTDGEGRFELQLAAGSSVLQLQRPGYTPSNEPQIIQVGPDLPEITLNLRPDALITGQVMFSDSSPAQGIRVAVYRRSVENGRSQWVNQASASTNSEGSFRLWGLQPGSYMLYTQMQLDREGQAGASYGYPAVYYPGTDEPTPGGILVLTAGQHAQADLTLTRQPFYPVTVRVAMAEMGGMSFQVYESGGQIAGVPVRVNRRDGTVQFSVPNGSYYLEAERYDMQNNGGGGGPRRGRSRGVGAYGRVDFRIANAPLSGLNLVLSPLQGLRVNVRKDFTVSNNNDTRGDQVVFAGQNGEVASNPGFTMMLSAAGDTVAPRSMSAQLTPVEGTNDDTAFEFGRVTPGKYWVTIFAFVGYVSSVTSGGVDLSREPLVVGAGGASAPLEVTLRDDTGTISGQITSLQSGSGANPGSTLGVRSQTFVYAIPLFSTSQQLMQGAASPSGDLSIPNLAPGTYRVIAFDHQQNIDFHSPEEMAKYSSMGKTVTVEAGGAVNVQLDSVETENGESSE